MPSHIIPFTGWHPDPPDVGVGNLEICNNLVMVGESLCTIDSISAPGSDPFTGDVTAAFRHDYFYEDTLVPLAGGYVRPDSKTFIGTTTKLYEGTSDVTRVSGNYGGILGPEPLPWPWDFVSWGEDVIATNLSDEIQKWDPTGAKFVDNYAGDTGASPQARFVSTLGQHIVIAHIWLSASFAGLASGFHPQLVWWSKTDDSSRWSDKGTNVGWNSGYQPLLDLPGPITGMGKVGDDALVIFTTNGCHLMQRSGDKSLYSFQVLAVGSHAGCRDNSSIVAVGRDLYWVNADGRIMVSEGLGKPVPIDSGIFFYNRVEQDIYDTGPEIWTRFVGTPSVGTTIASFNHSVQSGYLPEIESLIFWCSREEHTGGLQIERDRALVYHIPSGSFTNIDEFTWEASDGFKGFVLKDGSNYKLADFTYAVGSQKTTNKLAWKVQTKPMSLAPLEPAQLGVGVESTKITRVRPIMIHPRNHLDTGGDPLTLFKYPKVTITAADNPWMRDPEDDVVMDPNAGTPHLVSDQGWYDIPGGSLKGENFVFTVEGPADTYSISGVYGIEVDFQVIGKGGRRA